jgi:hypothetical protein
MKLKCDHGRRVQVIPFVVKVALPSGGTALFHKTIHREDGSECYPTMLWHGNAPTTPMLVAMQGVRHGPLHTTRVSSYYHRTREDGA